MMAGRQFFFATHEDLIPGLCQFEAAAPLCYLLDHAYRQRLAQCYRSCRELNDLGYVRDRFAPRYYLAASPDDIKYKRVVSIPRVRAGWRRNLAMTLALAGCALPGGSVTYEIRPRGNRPSLLFDPGGLSGNDVLVRGEVCVCGRTSVELNSMFVSLVFSNYISVEDLLVGPIAFDMLMNGVRLACDPTANPNLDLKAPEL